MCVSSKPWSLPLPLSLLFLGHEVSSLPLSGTPTIIRDLTLGSEATMPVPTGHGPKPQNLRAKITFSLNSIFHS